MDWLAGKKSYIVAIATVAYAVGGWYLGHLDANTATELVLAALGLTTLRAGIAKVGK